MRTLSFITLFATITLLASAVQAVPVSLYATPNESSRVIAVAEPGSSSLEHSQKVSELPGWNFAAYTGPITGYVALADVDDSGKPTLGAPLLLEPSSDAESIASIFPSDEVLIETSSNPEFFLVTFQSSIGLYYSDQQPVEVIIVDDVVGTVDTPPAVETPVIEAPAVATPAEVKVPAPTAPPGPKQKPTLVDTSFTLRGTLQTKISSFYFFAPRHRYLLKDDDGSRLAWLEIDNAVLARPLSSLIGKEVVIYGDRKLLPESRGAYIAVRSIRIAF
jgi:hypothetical protein|tara:strand:+ start:4698 stop:5525 length:828 start_codon:yes stop_codon:yes gene_type:complete